MRRTIVIGDLHGCYVEACELLDRLAVSASDRVIFAGDLVDRGPYPAECVDLAMRYECVLGNHEEAHLQRRPSKTEKVSDDHRRTRALLEDRHYDYFARLPLYIRLPEYNAAVVHAGAMGAVALEEQDPYHLLHAQCLVPPARKSYWPSKAPAEARFWTHYWKGPERLIFGHSVFDRALVTEHAVGIDTGCVFGRELTALVLPQWELVSVPAQRPHRSGKDVARILIHDGVHAFS